MVEAAEKAQRKRNVVAFWCLGLLNNFLYVVMNAGAHHINEAGIGIVYLASTLPCLLVKLSGPYWFHYVSYGRRMWIAAALMVASLFTVAWGESAQVKLLGVALASFQGGIGEASLLGMASFYNAHRCLAGWSSGTGFAGIGGYLWSILFSQIIGACFQLQLMVGLWIPVAWLVIFHWLLDEVDTRPSTDDSQESTSEGDNASERTSGESEDENVTSQLTCAERFRFTLTLWKYMVPLFLVYASEYIIQAGMWAAMGFPVTDRQARHEWYQWANLTYQVGVFISRSVGGLRVLNLKWLWAGPTLQLGMMVFFWYAAAEPFGNYWLILPALVVGLLGGFVYVQAFVLIAQKEDEGYVELALSTASLADTLGIIAADIVAIIVQGCLFGLLGVTDTKPNFTCGYDDIWANVTAVAKASAPPLHEFCFPGVQ